MVAGSRVEAPTAASSGRATLGLGNARSPSAAFPESRRGYWRAGHGRGSSRCRGTYWADVVTGCARLTLSLSKADRRVKLALNRRCARGGGQLSTALVVGGLRQSVGALSEPYPSERHLPGCVGAATAACCALVTGPIATLGSRQRYPFDGLAQLKASAKLVRHVALFPRCPFCANAQQIGQCWLDTLQRPCSPIKFG